MGPLKGIATGWLIGLWMGFANHAGPLSALALCGMGLCGLLAMLRIPGPNQLARIPTTPYMALALLAGACVGTSAPPAPSVPIGLSRLQVRVLQTQADARGGFASDVLVLAGETTDGGQRFAAGTRLRLRPGALREGEQVTLRAVLSPLQTFHNERPHPPWPNPRPLAGQGRTLGVVAGAGVPSEPLAALRFQLGRGRNALRRRLSETLVGVHAGLAQALLLGDRLAVPVELRSQVSAAGLSHVLAVSGLHISVMAGLSVWLLRWLLLFVPGLAARYDVGRIARGLGIPLALLLGPFCGGAPSAMRASLTAVIAWSLHLLQGRAKPGETLALAVVLLSLPQPELALSPGFILSIAATAAVLSAVDRTPPGRLAALRTALRVSLACTLATAPTILWCFGQLALLGPLANLIVVPWASLVLLPSAVAHAAMVSLCAPASVLTAGIFEYASGAFVGMSRATAEHGPALQWPIPSPAQAILCGALCGLFLARKRIPQHLALIATGGALLGLAVSEWALRIEQAPTGRLRVTFLDVGQGDAALIDLPDGQLMLVDAGGDPGGYTDPGERVVVPILRERRRNQLALAVLSHPHPDHYGGLSALLDAFPVAALWDNGQATLEQDISPSSAETVKLLAQATQRGTVVQGPAELCQHPKAFGAARLTLLWPCPGIDEAESVNDNSLVVRVDYGQTSVLFAGDIEAATERALLRRGLLQPVDVLKVPHHGSRTSSSEPFLEATRPRAAVISAGRSNRFGHPHPETLARLHRAVPNVFNLAKSGSLTVESDGKELHFHTWSGQRGRLPARGRTDTKR